MPFWIYREKITAHPVDTPKPDGGIVTLHTFSSSPHELVDEVDTEEEAKAIVAAQNRAYRSSDYVYFYLDYEERQKKTFEFDEV